MKSKVTIVLTIIYIVRLTAMDWTLGAVRDVVFGMIGGVLLTYWYVAFRGRM